MSIKKLNRVDIGLFFITIVALFFIYTYPSVLPQHPKAVHQWRQCDGLSITMMYVHNGLNPFQPEVHNRHGEGKTVAEFPIIYYVNAAIITVIGVRHKDTVTRGMNLMILYLGLFFLFRIGLIVFKNGWLALMPVIFLHSCPIVAYYAASSVPDVAALSFVITGIYFLIEYLINRKERSFWIALIFTALAGMIKSTILIPYLAFSFVLLLAVVTQHEKLKISFINLVLLSLPLLATFSWAIIAARYNAAHENITFLLNIKPIWGIERSYIDRISEYIKKFWIYEYSYFPLMWVSIGLGILFLVFRNIKVNLLKLGLVTLILGTTAYFYLFFEQFYEHDYYAIELLPMLFALFMAGIWWISSQLRWLILKRFFIFGISVLLILNVLSTRKNMIRRYTEDGQWNAYYDIYLDLTPKLRAAGIEFKDKVLVSSDGSPNISLYLIDQLGWTRFPYGLDAEMVEDYKKQGLKYIITREEDLVNRPFLEPYLNNEIIRYGNIRVYSL